MCILRIRHSIAFLCILIVVLGLQSLQLNPIYPQDSSDDGSQDAPEDGSTDEDGSTEEQDGTTDDSDDNNDNEDDSHSQQDGGIKNPPPDPTPIKDQETSIKFVDGLEEASQLASKGPKQAICFLFQKKSKSTKLPPVFTSRSLIDLDRKKLVFVRIFIRARENHHLFHKVFQLTKTDLDAVVITDWMGNALQVMKGNKEIRGNHIERIARTVESEHKKLIAAVLRVLGAEKKNIEEQGKKKWRDRRYQSSIQALLPYRFTRGFDSEEELARVWDGLEDIGDDQFSRCRKRVKKKKMAWEDARKLMITFQKDLAGLSVESLMKEYVQARDLKNGIVAKRK